MIEMTTIAWFAAGLVAGLSHATMLWRATHRLTAWTPAFGMLRLGVVAAVLVSAALSGAILAAAAGWVVGFVALGTWLAASNSVLHGRTSFSLVKRREKESGDKSPHSKF